MLGSQKKTYVYCECDFIRSGHGHIQGNISMCYRFYDTYKGHSVMSAHFTDEKTDFRKGEELAQGPTGDRWSSQGRT